MNPAGSTPSSVIELNVGGVVYATSLETLTKVPDSLFGQSFGGSGQGRGGDVFGRDSKGRCFIDRDGVLFRFVLDYLRNQRLVLPECFHEKERLRLEAEFYQLPGLVRSLGHGSTAGLSSKSPVEQAAQPGLRSLCHTMSAGDAGENAVSAINGSTSRREAGYILVGYRGTFAFGRDGCQADVKFRKMWRILVSGRVALCREVFKDTLNESRDVDRGTTDRYTARFFLKHTFLEQAFDMLQESGFRMVGACGSGTNSAGEMKPGMDSEETKWNHYNEFVFCRP